MMCENWNEDTLGGLLHSVSETVIHHYRYIMFATNLSASNVFLLSIGGIMIPTVAKVCR